MTRLEEIERTYCLEKVFSYQYYAAECGITLEAVTTVQLVSMSGLAFLGCGKTIDEMEQNCVEVFEIHQELWRKRLLTSKNLN